MPEIAPGIFCLPIIFVNVYFVQAGDDWVLVDTGLPGHVPNIIAAAQERFGAGVKPAAIVLTHGHFDHAGNARELADAWGVPIYAHAWERPYLSGQSDYPPQDPTIGGAISFMSRFFSTSGIDLGERLQELPADGSVPGLPGWRALHTPGHAPGHVSLLRPSDRAILAGDALATVDMDSFLALATKKPQISRPPAPFDYDWEAARRSAEHLADLSPSVLACGHGVPMSGPTLAADLIAFADNFPTPSHGRYVDAPATVDETGVVSVPPPAPDPLPRIALGIGLGALAGLAFALLRRRRK
ncbi:MAG: MBL fold metallo-hydrolase [Armatimonadota bacterium]|nr:MBL fold metallo-hydrolase [Armatimonadota bacterium]